MKSVKPGIKIFIGLLVALFAVVTAGGLRFYYSVPFDPGLFTKAGSGRGTVFLDRSGRELRFLPDAGGERARWIELAGIPKAVRDAFIAAEDERFYAHHGFDIRAILRAAWSNAAKQRIVSGASTISQQVVRLVSPDAPELQNAETTGRKRRYRDKLVEIVRSVRMERVLSKDEILEHYLNRVPMGNNLVGVETAARAYFGTSIQNISASEAALLASLPKAPGLLNPYGLGFDRLVERRNWVLARMAALGLLTREGYQEALRETIRFRRLAFPSAAPHVVDMLVRGGAGGKGRVRTTIDLDLQQRVQEVLASHADRLKYRGASQAAAIVLENSSMEVLAAAGSLDYSERNGGFNNGVRALRSAGSALKPFLYALALESGEGATLLLQDTERTYRSREGQYSPLNFDRKEYGPVTMRAALGSSLNLSAVKMLERLGEDRFYELLQRIGLINHPERGPGHYGLGMAIGNPEVSPEQLATAYAMLANGGVYRPARYVLPVDTKSNARSVRDREKQYVLLPQTAYIITDILSDPTARSLTFNRSRLMMSFPFKVAIKTGTSTFFRDLWAVGYTPDYTVAVWVGNFDGSATNNLSGSSAAVPIFADIMGWLHRQSEPVPFRVPRGISRARVCGYSGMKPSRYCTHTLEEPFIAGTEPRQSCSFHAGSSNRHELAASYAGWLYDKKRTDSAGRFTLAGFDQNLVFQSPWDGMAQDREPGIKPRNITVSKAVMNSRDDAGPHAVGARYHIGEATTVQAADPAGQSTAEIRIIYPLHQDRFVLNSHEKSQLIKLQAIVGRPVSYIDWFMNGIFFKRTGPPYQAYWPLEKGTFRITAVTPSNSGDSVRVAVE